MLTYADLNDRAVAVASELAARGVAAGGRVALLAQNSIDFVVAMHGIMRLGAVVVPLNPRLTMDEVAWQLGDSAATELVCHPSTRSAATAATAAAGLVAPLELPIGAAAAPPPPLGDSHGAADALSLIYTSGTTGRPKGAILTYGNVWASAAGSACNIGVLPGDRWLACMPLFHVGGLSILLRSAIYGTTVVVHPAFDESAVNDALRDEGISLLSLVPTMLQRMLDADELPYPGTVRAVLVGGGPVTRELLTRALSRGLPVLQTYGLSEAASQVTTLAPVDAAGHAGSAGKPLICTQVRIDAAPGEPGEILVSGPTVTPGYFGDPEATARAIEDGWLHTGDIGRMDSDGFLYVLDRREDLIVTGGENVYPADVEGHLLQHPLVHAAAVVGIPDGRWGQLVAAAVVAGAGFDPEEASAWLRQRMAAYKVPRRFAVVESLPATASGKVQRHRCRELFV